ncbi:MAG: ABC transporter permease [Chthonomonas sp.]|nr:ABC transporter permease [Chthonomonas sp.]
MQPIVATIEFIGECAIIVQRTLMRLFSRPLESGEWIGQMSFVGVNSIPIVVMTTLFSGAVLALYASDVLQLYGAGSLTGSLVGLAVTREIAPVLAGIMVAARCGSSMAAQIGQMAVTEQVDALTSLNVNPINYLVIPRFVACVLGLPILCLVGCYAGILGGLWVSSFSGVPQESFMNSLRQFVQPWDFIGGMIKTLVFGVIVSVVACQQGLRCRDGAVGVGRATTNSVVIAMVLIYFANFLLAAALY